MQLVAEEKIKYSEKRIKYVQPGFLKTTFESEPDRVETEPESKHFFDWIKHLNLQKTF